MNRQRITRRDFMWRTAGVAGTALAARTILREPETLAAAQSAPQNAPLRTTDSLHFSTGWYFHLGECEKPGGGQAMGTFEQGAEWDPVDLPHSFNAQNTFVPVRGYYRGIGWYRKHFTLSPEQAPRKVFSCMCGEHAATTTRVSPNSFMSASIKSCPRLEHINV